jgi:hypothetical protein
MKFVIDADRFLVPQRMRSIDHLLIEIRPAALRARWSFPEQVLYRNFHRYSIFHLHYEPTGWINLLVQISKFGRHRPNKRLRVLYGGLY